MKILIVGLGAIGMIYATKLKDAGFEPKILVDESRYERYKRNGRIFNGKRYDFDYILPEDQNYYADLVLIAVKSFDFNNVVENLNNFVLKDTIIMSLLNGISSEDLLRKRYPCAKVVESYYIGHASMRFENEIKYDGIGKIVFGGHVQIEDVFNSAGIEYEIADDMQASMWEKFIINIGINQTTAVLKSPYACFKNSEAREIANGLMAEGVEIAKRMGVRGTDKFIENAFKLIDSMPPNCKTSMMQDIERGQKTESDIFAGEICRMGRELGIATPKNEIVYQIIKRMEKAVSVGPHNGVDKNFFLLYS